MRILLIEDEFIASSMLSGLLQQEGHEVFHALNGEEGVRKAEYVRPELVISDFYLPGELNGCQAAEKIRAMIPKIPVIVITGFSREEVENRCQTVAPLAIMEKPIEFDPLSELIRSVN